MGCDTHAYHPSLRILRPYAAIDPQRREGGGNPREILRLFLFTSTTERADTPVSPERKPAGLQKEEAKAEADCGSWNKQWVRTWSVAVAPKGAAAKRSEPAGFDPGKHEGFGLAVTRGRVASGA